MPSAGSSLCLYSHLCARTLIRFNNYVIFFPAGSPFLSPQYRLLQQSSVRNSRSYISAVPFICRFKTTSSDGHVFCLFCHPVSPTILEVFKFVGVIFDIGRSALVRVIPNGNWDVYLFCEITDNDRLPRNVIVITCSISYPWIMTHHSHGLVADTSDDDFNGSLWSLPWSLLILFW